MCVCGVRFLFGGLLVFVVAVVLFGLFCFKQM